jgi:uncharacterized protein (TIGR03437 family)
MEVRQSRYTVRAGEAVPISAPQETLDFLSKAQNRRVDVVAGPTGIASGGLVASPNRTGDQILLGASLRTKPGQYTVNLSATSAAGEVRQAPLTVEVQPLVSVPSSATRAPVVLLNGWETGFNTNTCPVAGSSSDTFGALAQYLVTDGVPVVYLFDNCLEHPGQPIEVLANDLGAFLKTIQYDTGAQVPQIDLVAFSMGGLIARTYLAGLQANGAITPPATTLVNKLILIATPNFGSFVAGNYATSIVAGSQDAELIPGSAFLWNLATWNQRGDDLRGVDAIAIIGNAGTYTPSLVAGTALTNASDGLVSLTSASLGFVAADPTVTRIVPFCHVDPFAFTNTAFGTYACNAGGIANVTTATHQTGSIVRSFLSGTTDWKSIGTTPSKDPYLSKNGAIFFSLVNAKANYVSDMSSVNFGSVALTNGGDTGTIFYLDYALGTGTLSATSPSAGTINCGSWAEPVGYTSALRCKISTVIYFVGPLASTDALVVNPGTVTINGTNFGSQCIGCKVMATPAGSTARQLTTASWTNTAITATIPTTMTGLVTIQVLAAQGQDAITVMVNPQSTLAVSPTTLQFTAPLGGTAPNQSIQITNSASGTLNWTATAAVTSGAGWLSLSPSSGTAPSTLTVSVAPAGLAAGTYTGTISVAAAGASNTPASIGVTLIVSQAPAALIVTPQAMVFQYTNGGAVPPAQPISISNNGGGALAWTATASDYWLTVSPSSGSAPAAPAISVNPVNLAAGTYTGSVQVVAPGAANSPTTVSVTLSVTGTQPAGVITGVQGVANYQPTFSSATWVSIFGTNLSQSTYQWQGSDFVNNLLPTSLQGVSVTINGIGAFVEYISPTQINVLAPDDTATGPVQVVVTTAGQNSNSFTTTRAAVSPAFFTMGDGAHIAAQHSDYSLLGAPGLIPGVPTTPAKPGETIILYATGFGPTNPPLPTSQLVATAEPLAAQAVITFGGESATVIFGGLVSPGLYQFNVTVPGDLPNGDTAVVAKLARGATQNGLSITIQQ